MLFGQKGDNYEAVLSLVVALDRRNLATVFADTAGKT